MDHKQKLFTAILVKEATPRWAKMLAQGKLSPDAVKRLEVGLPQNVTRQIGTKALGEGVEGKVFPSFTGGQGHTATKVFFDRPALEGTKGVFTNGAQGLGSRLLGGYSLGDRVSLMQNFPALFPKILGTNARGYTMPKLQDITHNPSTGEIRDFVSFIRQQKSNVSNLKTKLESMTQRDRTLRDKLTGKPGTPRGNPLDIEDYQRTHAAQETSLNENLKRLTRLRQDRHALRSLETQVRQVDPSVNKIHNPAVATSEVKPTFVTLPSKSGPVTIRDFGTDEFGNVRNIMRTPSGRAVVSDPMPEDFSSLHTVLNPFPSVSGAAKKIPVNGPKQMAETLPLH